MNPSIPDGSPYTGDKIKSIYWDIDHPSGVKRLDVRRLNAENPDWVTGIVGEMEQNWREAAEMLKRAMERFHEHWRAPNITLDDGDRRHDKRQVVFKERCVTHTALTVAYDRLRAESEVKHWKEYLNWSSAKENGRAYEKP